MKTVGIYQQEGVEQNLFLVGNVAQIFAKNCNVEIVHHLENLDKEAWQRKVQNEFGLDISRVDFRYVPTLPLDEQGGLIPKSLKQEANFGKSVSEPYDVFLCFGNQPPLFCHARYGIFWTDCPQTSFDDFYGHVSSEWRRLKWITRFLRTRHQKISWQGRFASYRMVLCPSAFSQQMCWKTWQVTPHTVPFPIFEGVNRSEKSNIIVTYGRFSVSNRQRHEVIISIFQDFCDRMIRKFSLDTDWSLWVMGECGDTEADRDFVERLRMKAFGYPIHFAINWKHEDVLKKMSEATFFWSAMGYEANNESGAEYFETSGRTTLEAQYVGAIPMVFHAGAQPEIIHHGMNGFLWSTARELLDMTTAILVEKRILPVIENGAIKNAEDCPKKFRANLKKKLRGIVDLVDE